jgi:hypothetical protein
MEFHPLANAFPLLEGAEFDELVASIRARGQLEKIIARLATIGDGGACACDPRGFSMSRFFPANTRS